MKDKLNKYLPLELTAHVRYNGHACILKFHGYNSLANKYAEEAAEELEHANKVIWRIQELGGFPNYLPNPVIKPLGSYNILEILKTDLETEKTVLKALKPLIEEADVTNDYGTSELLRELTKDTEDHITWINTQLLLINEIGINNYLQAQM